MLKDDFVRTCKVNRFSEKTIKTYWGFVVGYIKFNDMNHPNDLSNKDVENYIKHLATDCKLSYSSQNLAFMALLFLYRKVLKRKLKIRKDWRTKRPQRLPDYLSKEDVTKIIAGFEGSQKLITQLLYGCGLRLSEALGLRYGDVDLDGGNIFIRASKGDKDGILPLPKSLIDDLRLHLIKVEKLFNKDIKRKFNGCVLPDSIKNKSPEAALELAWQYIFPAKNLIKSCKKRYHLHQSTYSKNLKQVAKEAGINKRVYSHLFRHSFVTHLNEAGYPLTYIQQLARHSSIRTTQGYTHTTQVTISGYNSPLDTLKPKEDNLRLIKWAN